MNEQEKHAVSQEERKEKRRSREQKRIACMNCPQKMTD